jgi:nicotinate-nucleotide adenylyltransferase
MTPVGIFGGTFDPIHYGHLRTAFELMHVLRCNEVRFVPSRRPPHRDATAADPELRLNMVTAAIAGQRGFVLDDREFQREGPSYTVDTLMSLRADLGETPLALIIGMDAFLGFTTWHRFKEILELAHIVVAQRPGWRAPDMGVLGELIASQGTLKIEDLHARACGRVHIHAVTQLEISSREVRELIAVGRDPRFLMPDAVRDIIMESGCYR